MCKAVDTVFNRWQSFVVGDEEFDKKEGPDSEKTPDFRSISLVIAIERVAQATLMRGIWP